MFVILLSGGSGKRLWPLSDGVRSKQFLRYLADEHGATQSMLERLCAQIRRAGLQKCCIISAGEGQKETIRKQIGADIFIATEPETRDTFPAISLACAYLTGRKNVSNSETVVVMPVDSYVEDEFFDNLQLLEKALINSDADIALLGVRPNYPATRYGYMVPAQTKGREYLNIQYFIEKPDEEQAKELIEKNALWNCGVFAFRPQYLSDILIERGLPVSYDEMLELYGIMPKISFDYEVVENANNIVAIPYGGIWHDLGTWDAFCEKMVSNIAGFGFMTEDCINTTLINETDVPVIVVGLSDTVVVSGKDGILVTDKKVSGSIKNIINLFESKYEGERGSDKEKSQKQR